MLYSGTAVAVDVPIGDELYIHLFDVKTPAEFRLEFGQLEISSNHHAKFGL